jgi:hypothetical protein
MRIRMRTGTIVSGDKTIRLKLRRIANHNIQR